MGRNGTTKEISQFVLDLSVEDLAILHEHLAWYNKVVSHATRQNKTMIYRYILYLDCVKARLTLYNHKKTLWRHVLLHNAFVICGSFLCVIAGMVFTHLMLKFV